jgi:AcrR family transcriptional regulator
VKEAQIERGTFYIHFADLDVLLVAIHNRFHTALFETIAAATEHTRAGPDRLGARREAFLDGFLLQRGTRALLVEARGTKSRRALTADCANQAAKLITGDLRRSVGIAGGRLLVAATTEPLPRRS